MTYLAPNHLQEVLRESLLPKFMVVCHHLLVAHNSLAEYRLQTICPSSLMMVALIFLTIMVALAKEAVTRAMSSLVVVRNCPLYFFY